MLSRSCLDLLNLVSEDDYLSCTNLVKPPTPLASFLERLQETALATSEKSKFDPKTYVDLPLKLSLSKTEEALDKLVRSANGSVPADELNVFMERYFDGAGDDLVYYELVDYVEEPEVRAWALEVYSLRKNLNRRVSSGVKGDIPICMLHIAENWYQT